MMSMHGGADREAQALKEKILNAKDELTFSGKCYHISNNGNDDNDGLTPETAWATFDKFHAMGDFMEEGDALLLERGSTWRVYKDIDMKTGVTYAAYGEGPKPCLLGNDKNYADPAIWSKSEYENVWVADFPEDCRSVGNIIFDIDKFTGYKRPKTDLLKEDLDFCSVRDTHKLYLYHSKGNPGEIYKDIDLCLRFDFFSCWNDYTHDVTIDNICMKYCSGGGIAFCTGGNSNITVTNCEIGWIGGDYVDENRPRPLRAGNAIGFWDDQKNVKVSNNWIYQDYEAGISPQGEANQYVENMEFSNNLIEYCGYSFEIWTRYSTGKYKRLKIFDNILRFSGYGWSGWEGKQKTDPEHNSHFNGFPRDMSNVYEDSTFKNNIILDISSHNLVAWHWDEGGTPELLSGLEISGNSFYQHKNPFNQAMWYGYHPLSCGSRNVAYCQADLEELVLEFDKNPKAIKWIESEDD